MAEPTASGLLNYSTRRFSTAGRGFSCASAAPPIAASIAICSAVCSAIAIAVYLCPAERIEQRARAAESSLALRGEEALEKTGNSLLVSIACIQ